MEITKELKEKLLKANSEEEVKAILGDEATQEEAAFVWEKVQAKKAEGLEAVDDEELEAVSGGALWCLFGGEYAADGKEVGCVVGNYDDWAEANEKICKNGNADIGWYHDWDEGEEFLSGKRYYVRCRCKKCNKIKTTPTGWYSV